MGLTHLTNQVELGGGNRDALEMLVKNVVDVPITLSQTEALVGGVMRVSIGWSAVRVNVAGTWLALDAGSKVLNVADVASPTTYYIYARNLSGAVVVSSTLDPEDDPGVNYEYAWIATCRFDSIAGTATIYYVRRAYCALDLLLHHAGEWDLYSVPEWQSGGVISIAAASGLVDMTEINYKRLRFEGHVDAIDDGLILYGDEGGSAANLELITTYRDGSAITAGKYIKLLLGVITSPILDFPFMVIRQNKPVVEYATRAAALIDAERVAGTSFPDAYRANCIPLAYVIMLKGDASDLETVDLRGSVGGGGGGGGTPVADHSLLANLGADDHAQYLRTDGTRTLADNMLVAAGKAIDGVDISAHLHTGAGLNGPQLDHGAALTGLGDDDHTIYLLASGARALAGNMAAGAGVTFDGVDVGSHLHTGAAGMGPQLTNAAISDFNEAAQDAVGGILVSNNDIVLTYNDGVPSIAGTLKTTGELQVVLAAGANNDVNIGTALLIYITGPAGNFNITGLTGGYAGRRVFLFNTTGSNMTMTNESAGSVAGNRILTLGSAAATNNTGIINLIYSALQARWLVVGEWD